LVLKQKVLAADIVNTDDTPVPVQNPARNHCRTGRIWVYVSWQSTVSDATADRSLTRLSTTPADQLATHLPTPPGK
jgi:hypothetical protein